MGKVSRCCFLLTGLLLAARLLRAEEGIRGNLVTASWLQNHRTTAEVLVLDASPAQAYAANHIPGAISVDLFTYGLPETAAAEMETRFQSWGVSPGKNVVLYDQGGNILATRVLFSLYYYGFPANNLFILDGGFFKWQQEGLPVTKESTPAPQPGSFRITEPKLEAAVDLPEFLTASGDPVHNVLLEALGADWHFGEVRAFDRAGHIPHGILLPSADFYNPDRTFKSPQEIGKMLAYLGVRPDQRVYTYCGGGVAASVPFFALKFILNYPDVKLYRESELGWLADERGLPYWTYDAPFLMRGATQVQFWTSPMPRAMGLVHASVVDVRPAQTFNQGHVPFALNIPAELFQRNLADPAKLSEILGAAGVQASDEAVVVSDAGLSPESALAFLMLEKLGQKRTSVLMDSMDRWAQLGFALPKEATAVGPKKFPQDLSIPPAAYAAKLRQGILITDTASTEGVYPKVFLASGRNVPAQVPEGKVVHVAYTDLLNPDGTPKAAKDLWKILVKAGVPRYAELVCFSENAGEAAVNYFILKLMGYPDIKVLVL